MSDAYREAYNASNMKPGSIHREASVLMSNPMITQRVERLQRQKDRAVIASSLTDRERVLTKLRDTLDTTEGGPAVTAQLRAAELLGKSIGIFKDVQVKEEPVQTAAEIREEIQRRLAELKDEHDDAVH